MDEDKMRYIYKQLYGPSWEALMWESKGREYKSYEEMLAALNAPLSFHRLTWWQKLKIWWSLIPWKEAW